MEHRLISSELRGGIWTVVLSGGAPVGAQVRHDGRVLPGLELTEGAGRVTVRLPLPGDLLADGVQVLLLTDDTGTRLAQLTLIAGPPADVDLRGEISLLRAELDLLKQAFRSHCRTGGA